MINILVILYIEQKFEIITRSLDLIIFHRIMRCIDNPLLVCNTYRHVYDEGSLDSNWSGVMYPERDIGNMNFRY